MSCRRGVAIVASLALLLLAAALLASAAVSASSLASSAERARLSLVAEVGARRAIARLLSDGDPGIDTLAIGAAWTRSRPLDIGDRSADVPAVVVERVQRIAATVYALGVDVRVGMGITARRRFSIIVRRATLGERAAPGALVPIARWSTADLY